ncbi:thiamine pyrophosphate-binding protein [Bradyrhizobium sp. CCGUVB1N3]|uniref:thiamine pyrophosphate-binding protein n=1 Tax=Bradyrhizobium sp. CCGUVB1N3 TaxID=2949629 RepID=UPI0020B38DB1|nr:thiamine pyrophosphate-binding protein [Bradyrhizobium sp. CCGUVB1N3]MCP3473325.1 thiamine pyrophosphate-binding protein [Bradyrhizobium sp. CCGUVB1N3]
MKNIERPAVTPSNAAEWGSDVAAQMLRVLDIPYVALNPGASYRGFHDSLVNNLGNETPQMLLCLNEDHVVSIAHGYAKATDKAMACVLHSNVGLLHGSMGIFNAWCDRAPMIVIGATGPVAPEKRRPWIDWIHTAKDQGALLRDFIKWDDEPRSPHGIVEAFLRGAQLTNSQPTAPVYICLDAGLQEQKLDEPMQVPSTTRYQPATPPRASRKDIEAVAGLLASAKNPLILFGRGGRSREAWDNRVKLAELTGASVMTSIRERAIFPTEHKLHAVPPFYWLSPTAKEAVRKADVIVSFDWVDLNGVLLQMMRKTEAYPAKIAHVTLDASLHRGWSMDYFALPPVDIPVVAGADGFVEDVLTVLETRLAGKSLWKGDNRNTAPKPAYTPNAETEMGPRDIEVALAKVRGNQTFTLAHVTIGWAGDVYQFRDPLDFMGHDGGAGLAAGPGLTIGVALALKDQNRPVVAVLGDGDFMQGVSALWTAAHYGIPALFIVSNNRSNFNDELHQEAVARMRGRPPENRWIGQRIAEPVIDLAAMAKAQGIASEGPVKTASELEAAIERGLAAVRAGRPYLIDAHVAPGYSNPPLSRGE